MLVPAEGRFYRSQVLLSGRLFELFKPLKNRGALRAANLLAFAVYAARLRRRLVVGDDAILFLPDGSALAENSSRINEL